MSDGKPPDLLIIFLTIVLAVFLVQMVFFSKTAEIGVFVILGVFIYLWFFIVRDKSIKRRELNDSLRIRKNNFDFFDLPDEIP